MKGFSGISLGSSKSNVPGNPSNMESLEDYADYITSMILDGSGVTVSWEDTYWAEESLDDPGSSAAGRAELVNSMESQANGPFAIDWNMELKKEW